MGTGPGSYVAHTLIDSMAKKPWGKNGVFGSTERRFVPASGANGVVIPGPG